ncbi:MAG: hypothetical protein U9N80_05220 [Chloroflexota bacterium]|nr:hypothetical protein [Chloroflexota bacterium]
MCERVKPMHKGNNPENLAIWRERITESRQRAHQQEDSGHLTAGLFIGFSQGYLILAMIDYYLDESVEVVKAKLELSAQYNLNLWQHKVAGVFRGGDRLFPFINAKHIAAALTAGRWDLAEAIARIMDEARDAGLYREKRSISYWDAYGWLIKHLVLEEDEQAVDMANRIINHRRKAKKEHWTPLAQMALALVQQDTEALEEHLRAYLAVHDRLVKRGGWWEDADGMMCFPGMAFIVMARKRQVPLDVDSPYLFLDLLEQ